MPQHMHMAWSPVRAAFSVLLFFTFMCSLLNFDNLVLLSSE